MARDKKILGLVDVINDTLNLIRQAEKSSQLKKIELYKETFRNMALQIVECGYFIHAYMKHDFSKYLLSFANSCLVILYGI